MTRSRATGFALAFIASVANPASPQQPATLLDRVVAVVDEDPILLSDIERTVGLGLVARAPGEADAALRRRALDGLVEQMIRQHEIARFGVEEAALVEVEQQLEQLRARFAGDQEWRAELARLGLGEAQVRALLAHQLAVLHFVEDRLGPRVFVSVDDIRAHYDEQLVPELRARGAEIPAIETVREAIRALLREVRLNREIERWTGELRAAADVVDLLDADDRPAPPAVLVIEADPPR